MVNTVDRPNAPDNCPSYLGNEKFKLYMTTVDRPNAPDNCPSYLGNEKFKLYMTTVVKRSCEV